MADFMKKKKEECTLFKEIFSYWLFLKKERENRSISTIPVIEFTVLIGLIYFFFFFFGFFSNVGNVELAFFSIFILIIFHAGFFMFYLKRREKNKIFMERVRDLTDKYVENREKIRKFCIKVKKNENFIIGVVPLMLGFLKFMHLKKYLFVNGWMKYVDKNFDFIIFISPITLAILMGMYRLSRFFHELSRCVIDGNIEGFESGLIKGVIFDGKTFLFYSLVAVGTFFFLFNRFFTLWLITIVLLVYFLEWFIISKVKNISDFLEGIGRYEIVVKRLEVIEERFLYFEE